MITLIHCINIYCDTLTKGVNFYFGQPVNFNADPDAIADAINRIKLPVFVKKIEIDNQPLSDKWGESTIDIYVTFQIRRRADEKRTIEPREEKRLNAFINNLVIPPLAKISDRQSKRRIA